MPTYGCFRMQCTEPDRTWTADRIVPSGDQIQFWNRGSGGESSDVLVGSVRLEKGHTVCDVTLTSRTEPGFYQSMFDDTDPQNAYPYLG